MNKARQSIKDVTDFTHDLGDLTDETGKLTGALFGSEKSNPKPTETTSHSVSNGSVLSGGTQIIDGKKYFTNPAPKGTRIIIPTQISSTGKERYLGANTLESIANMHAGNPKCANVIVYGVQNQPSSKFYDFGPNGEILLKGTNQQIQFDPNDPPVRLSETEYISIIQSLNAKPSEITYFKTDAGKGDAENSKASSPSWFSKNWWKILLGMLVAAGVAWGGIALYNKNKEDKAKKNETTNTVATNTNENTNTVSNTNTSATQTVSTGLSTAQNITNQTGTQQILNTKNSNSI